MLSEPHHNYLEDIDNVDEELDKMCSTNLARRITAADEEWRTRIYERIVSVLRDGIVIGEKKFEFLAFSSS